MNENGKTNDIREKYWIHYRNGLDQLTEKKEQAAYNHFFNGGIVELLESNLAPNGFGTIIENTPAITSDELIQEITDYYFWFKEDESRMDYWHRRPDMVEILSSGYLHLFTSPALNKIVARDLFYWICGRSYELDRKILFEKDDSYSEVNFQIEPNKMSFDLVSHLTDHFWRKERRDRLSAFQVKEYFYSVYPHMDEVCFSIEIPEDEDFEHDGKSYRKAWVEFNHRFIALLNGYLTDFETFEEIEEWHCYDLEGLEIFKEELSKVKMPPAYYKLEEYILSFEQGHIFELAW
jgi:hypothetical protein